MQYRKLGSTDIEVSTIAMGCWAIVGDATWGPQEEVESIATIEAAIESGITLFDTAEAYGNGYSEEVLGKVLPAHRDAVVIASKFGAGRPVSEIREACEDSLKRLKTDWIDLYQIHWPSSELPYEEAYSILEGLKDEGKIRSIGVSNFGEQDLDAYLQVGRAESNQLAYNMLFRALEHAIRPRCEAEQIGILCYSPLAQGLLTGKFTSADEVPEGRARTRLFSKDRPQSKHGEEGAETEVFEALAEVREISGRIGRPMADVALAWLLQQGGVTSVLAGMRNVDQVAENARAGDLVLPDDVLRDLSEATEPVKAKLGTNPDMWNHESRIH
ncbi:MAG: aldo/keto reductase [Candidatus Latescibacteria bacterium]|jgi:aryl-alcohol dehydrogenase-like predicted oxidoreductase|nr:aldo/keto reductase [Candidatus Latescibacterota bacterium]